MSQNPSFRPVHMLQYGVIIIQSCSSKLKQIFATDKIASVLSFKCSSTIWLLKGEHIWINQAVRGMRGMLS